MSRILPLLVFGVVEVFLLYKLADLTRWYWVLFALLGALAIGAWLIVSALSALRGAAGQAAGARVNQAFGFMDAFGASASREDAKVEAISGLFRLLSGILFILPGMLSDVLALALLLPPVQQGLGNQLRGRMAAMASSMPQAANMRGQKVRSKAPQDLGDEVELYPPGTLGPERRLPPKVIDVD